MVFTLKKTSNKKKTGGQKGFILAKDIIAERLKNMKSKNSTWPEIGFF